MPRTLARLRYRPVRKGAVPRLSARSLLRALDRARQDPDASDAHERLHRRLTSYVAHRSKAPPLHIHAVVHAKAARPPTGPAVVAPKKPFTLRRVVDPGRKARHGEIVYIFRNVKTNQIVYSLQELLDDHHRAQLPFIGKHSKPPVLRPDEWTPHCVLTFPAPEQGRNAYRQLREFRKLHEMSWDKTNPEWKKMDIRARVKKIMDQRANTSADIAEVLHIQQRQGAAMREAVKKQRLEASEYLAKKWAEIDALADAAKAAEKQTDSVKWLEHQIRSLTRQLAMKHNQNDADQRRLKNAKIIQEIRLRKVEYAHRKAGQLKAVQEELEQAAAPANEAGAKDRLLELRNQASVLNEALADPDPTRPAKDIADDRSLLRRHERDIASLKKAFAAKARLDKHDHPVARSVLPPQLNKTLPTPYTLNGVSVRWADIKDALYASGKWPASIEHEVLDIHKNRNSISLLSKEEYDIEVSNEASAILQALEDKRERKRREEQGRTGPEAVAA